MLQIEKLWQMIFSHDFFNEKRKSILNWRKNLSLKDNVVEMEHPVFPFFPLSTTIC